MAKKKAAKKAAVKGSKAKKKAPAKAKDEQIEIKLDVLEQQALDLVQKSDDLCNDLEKEVTQAVAKSVAIVFKKHKIKLTPAQAENVALILFGN
jgi:transposase